MTERYTLDYAAPGPVLSAFLEDRSFVSGIMGPIGSGKTTGCIVKACACSQAQVPDSRGRRRSRGAIIRNTYPELNTTTIKSWHEWIPRDVGKFVPEGPPSHVFSGAEGLEVEVLFLALDRPEDVRKLLSLELTWAYINEAREVPKAIVDALTGRIGRFPPVRDGGCVDPMLIMDTNPPDTDHWYYKLAEETRPDGFAFFRQPSGLSADAENLANLPPAYYTRAAAGKDADYIKVYIEGGYGFVREGKPCYHEYADSMHCGERYDAIPGLPLRIGLDFGLTPAAVFLQRKITGAWRAIDEIVTDRMGATGLAVEIKKRLAESWPGFEVEAITGDPSGDAGGNDDKSVFQIMRANGVEAKPANTNDFTTRREAVGNALGRIVDGEPGLALHPRCRTLRKACGGGYHFRRVMVAGADRFTDKPDKNSFSHVAEALQYALLGGGEGRAIRSVKPAEVKPTPSRIRLNPSAPGAWMG